MSGEVVSIEKALNSRCSSGFGPRKSHFGTFVNKRPPETVIDQIINCLNIPRFSTGKLLHWLEDEYLFLGFENPKNPSAERVLHVESGMQHEAVYLACAAEAVGTCAHNLGTDGTSKEGKTTTTKHRILEIIDPYGASKFTTRAPGPEKPFFLGKNLTTPSRDSGIECVTQLPKLTTSSRSGPPATERDMSQLLWAARGRTPHFITIDRWKHMWGLTVPTWGGVQDYTSVYLVKSRKLYRYVNWTKEFSLMNRTLREKLGWTRGNPTHDIRFVGNVDASPHLNGHEKAIVLCQNEGTGRALWEIGYMLENMLLQATSLGISYESKVFSVDEASELNEIGVANAVAAVFM
ncbi:MAG: hypothetical protein ABSD73_11395 [Candidatus Bathyarchaeia archaeon]|jgi:hypothetical protein